MKPQDENAPEHAGHSAACHHDHATGQPHAPAPIKDPVCGMTVAPDANKPTAQHDGQTYHFCSSTCHDKFVADPAHYLNGAHKTAKVAPKGTQYTCPMHPEIVRDAPGECPKCGMALEPMGVPSADDGPNPELVMTPPPLLGRRCHHPATDSTHGRFVGLGFIHDDGRTRKFVGRAVPRHTSDPVVGLSRSSSVVSNR
ncbi:MAG: heavy metal-binding domain-containing protein [Rhodocyclaceae bacterium]